MPKQRKPLVLAVDDNPDAREILQIHLGSMFDFVFADTLQKALTIIGNLKPNKPDAILLDLRLPDSSGAATLHAIEAACPERRVTIASGYPDQIEQVNNGNDRRIVEKGTGDDMNKIRDGLVHDIAQLRIREHLDKMLETVGNIGALVQEGQVIAQEIRQTSGSSSGVMRAIRGVT